MYFLFKLAVMRSHAITVIIEEERANEEEDVIWSKAKGEDSNYSIGQQADLPLHLATQARTLVHCRQHPPVAHSQHQQGQKEADAHSDQVEQGDGSLYRVGLVTTVVVVDVVMGIFEVVIDQH